MKKKPLHEIEPGVLKLESKKPGPPSLSHDGTTYYRFMDFLYIQNRDFDDLAPEVVSNLCRARAKYPHLISVVNQDVRRIFRALVEILEPMSLLEIGSGKSPIFGIADCKIDQYILADADSEVVKHQINLNRNCYKFSDGICEIPSKDILFDMAIAIFVLHFPFYPNQIAELYKRMKKSGVFIANVYRRDSASRKKLTFDITNAGFEIIKVQDVDNLCREHEYWILGKEDKYIQNCALALKEILLT
jgi:hypothetical protein